MTDEPRVIEVAICSRHFSRRTARKRRDSLNNKLTSWEQLEHQYRVRRYGGRMFRWAVVKIRKVERRAGGA